MLSKAQSQWHSQKRRATHTQTRPQPHVATARSKECAQSKTRVSKKTSKLVEKKFLARTLAERSSAGSKHFGWDSRRTSCQKTTRRRVTTTSTRGTRQRANGELSHDAWKSIWENEKNKDPPANLQYQRQTFAYGDLHHCQHWQRKQVGMCWEMCLDNMKLVGFPKAFL